MDIRERLFSLQDLKYRDFQAGLIPTIDPAHIIGVRMPQLRALAKEIAGTGEATAFLNSLPHTWYEENILHGILISAIRDPEACISALDTFLPYVDNWAACDVISPKAFRKHPPALPDHIRRWIRSEETYTCRFGIRMLMDHYLDEAFREEYLIWAAEIVSEEYYVRMAAAWYFATALAKQPAAALPFIREERLDPWTHNKTIQKAIESFRIPPELKEELRTFRRKQQAGCQLIAVPRSPSSEA